LYEEVKKIIIETAIGIEERQAIEMEAIGCDRDHIHLLCSAHPKIAPGRIVQIFKMFSPSWKIIFPFAGRSCKFFLRISKVYSCMHEGLYDE